MEQRVLLLDALAPRLCTSMQAGLKLIYGYDGLGWRGAYLVPRLHVGFIPAAQRQGAVLNVLMMRQRWPVAMGSKTTMAMGRG